LTSDTRTIEQPLKIPFIAAVVLVLNTRKPEFTTDILKRLRDATQSHLEAGNWREVKLFLRFWGCIQGLLEGDGVFTLLEELFSRAVDLQTSSSEDVRIPAGLALLN
jgi:nuclear cap-binding protein subunit 1